MTHKSSYLYKASLALLLVLVMLFNFTAYSIYCVAEGIASLATAGDPAGTVTGSDQTVGEGDPSLGDITIPTVNKNPYQPTVHQLLYPVMRSDLLDYSEDVYYTLQNNSWADGHSRGYTASLSAMIGYYTANRYYGSYATQHNGLSNMRENTLNPDLFVYGQKLGFTVNDRGAADDYTNFLGGSYVYDYLHLNKDHLTFELRAKQIGNVHVKMEVDAWLTNGKTHSYDKEMASDGEIGSVRVPLKDVYTISGNVDGYAYNGKFTDVVAMLIDDTSPSVTDITVTQNMTGNDNAELVMKMTFNEGIRFADLKNGAKYLNDMWVEVEIEEIETGKTHRVKLYVSDVGTDCTMTLRADIGRFHYKQYRVNRVTRTGFSENVSATSFTPAVVDIRADVEDGVDAALYSYQDASKSSFSPRFRIKLTPITDIAGNSLHLDSIVNWQFGQQFNSDSFGIEEISIYNDKTLGVTRGDIAEEDLLPEDLFIGTTSNMTVMVNMSRILTEAQWKTISLKLNLIGPDGEPIVIKPTRATEYSRNYLYDNGTLKGSVLLFENIRLPAGTLPDIEEGGDPLIRVTELMHGISEYRFYPYFDNPITDMRVDLTSPTVSARLVSDQTVENGDDRYYTAVLELTLADVVNYERIAGLVGGDLTLSLGAGVEENVNFRYRMGTDVTPPATAEDYTGEGVLSKNGFTKVGYINIVSDPLKVYLHLLIEQDGIYVNDLKLDARVTDAVGNPNDQTEIPILVDYLIDEVPPEVSITGKTATATEGNTKMELAVGVSATDPSAVERIEYFVGIDPYDAEATWTPLVISGDTDATATVNREYGGIGAENGIVSETVWVRAYDRFGNCSEPVSTFVQMSLEKPSTNAQLLTDGNEVRTDHAIRVQGPAASSLDGTDAYTRVTLSPLMGNGFAYVVLVKTGESVNVLDLADVTYYKVEIATSVNTEIYTDVSDPYRYRSGETVDEDHILYDLFNYYGDLKISFENGFGDMTPVVGQMTFDQANEGSYYKDPNYMTVRFASPYGEDRAIHSLTFGKVVNRADELVTEALTKGGSPAVIYQSESGFGAMRNMQIHFSIANIANAGFGYLDLDYQSSYVELLQYVEGGNGILRSRADGLSAAGSQYFTVGNTDDEGNLYETGAYYLRVTVRSKSGHEDVFESGLLVLDAQTADSAGVWEYRFHSPSNIQSVNDPTSYSPVEHTRDPATEEYFTDFGISVMAGGETMRSRLFAMYSYGASSLSVVLSAPNVTKTVAGVEVGRIKGYRLWNALSEPSAEQLASAPFLTDYKSESRTFYNRLTDIYDKDTIPKGLEAIGELHLVKGVNTICYQVQLENGYISPIRYFTVTVTDKAPTLNVAIDDYIPSHQTSSVEGVVNVDSIRMFVETAYSFNGSGRVDVQLWGTYAMSLGLYGADGFLAERYVERDESGEELQPAYLSVLRSGLQEGEYAVLTENSYTSDFPNYTNLCTAVFVAVDEYGGTTIIAPQIGHAQRHRVYGGVANEKEYNLSYYGQYYDDPYVLDDNVFSWRVVHNEASYNGNILLGFESYLLYNDSEGERRVKTLSTADASLGHNLFNISTNDIVPRPFETEITYGVDLQGATVDMKDIQNAGLITSLSTITIWGDGINGEVTIPLFEPNTEYGYLGAELRTYGSEKTVGIRFGFANPKSDASNPHGTELKRNYRLNLDNGYGESFSSPDYLDYSGSGGSLIPWYAGDFSVYYIDYTIKEVVMTESGALLTPGFATVDGINVKLPTGKFNPDPAAGSDGKYTIEIMDLFGNLQTVEYEIVASQVADAGSIVEISKATPTAKAVQVTIQRPATAIFADIVDYDIMSVEGNGTSHVTVTLTANARFSYRYLNSEGEEMVYFVDVDNIVKPNVTVTFDPDPEKPVTDTVTGEQFLYGEVRAYITDPNFEIIDAVTGLPAVFTFMPGGASSYTYPAGTLVARLGGSSGEEIALGEITVSLKYPLREVPSVIESTDDDIAPALQVLAYSNQAGEWSEERLAMQLTSRRGLLALTAYDGYTVFGFSGERANMAKLLNKMGWSTSYRFVFEVSDDSRVRLFLKEGLYAEAPAFENGISDPIDGVELNSKLLTVSKAAKFTVFAVDANGNASSVAFDVNNVGEAPRPIVTKVPIEGGIRAYIIAPEGAEDLQILSTGITVGIETAEGEFKGLPYVDLKKNDTHSILYQMTYNGREIAPTTVDVAISELRPDEITLSGGIAWSANKLSEATASDVVASLLFSDTVEKIVAVSDYDKDTVIFTRSGGNVTVTFKENSAPITFRCYADNGSFVTVELDGVTNIDRSAPVITYEKQLAADAKSLTLTLKVSERVTFKEGGGFVGQPVDGQYVYTRVITDNGEYTYTFTNMAGLSASVTVVVDELVLEPLSAQFSKDQSGADAVDDPARIELTVGETVFVKPSRDATVELSDGRAVQAPSTAWTALSIPEALGGISPYVTVTDAYGNVYVGQFASVVPLDTAPPELVINKDIWTVRAGSDRAEVEAALIANAAAFDDSGEQVTVSVEFPESLDSIGIYDVRYYATDASGNTAEAYGRLRVTSIYDPVVYLDGIKIDRDDGIYLKVGEERMLTVNSAGVKFDLYLVTGRRTAAQIKGETPLANGSLGGDISLGELDAGIYTVLIVTEQRDYFRFLISVTAEEPGT